MNTGTNTFGIDYQMTTTIICLREGCGDSSRFCSVGDGLRKLIPNAVVSNVAIPNVAIPNAVIPNAILVNALWGSQAFNSQDPHRLTGCGDIHHDGPWLAQPGADILWRQIYHRLYSFLGRLRPNIQNGYQVVVGLQASPSTYKTATTSLNHLCTTAGFNNPAFIPATEAVLCRWIAEQTPPEKGETLTVIVVVVGDVSTLVSAYQVQPSEGVGTTSPYARFKAVGQPAYLAQAGQFLWTSKLLQLIYKRLIEPILPEYELAMRDAAIEFIIRLAKASSSQQIDWTGPFCDRMYTPFSLSRDDCELWPEVSSFTSDLTQMIQKVLSSISTSTDRATDTGKRNKPDLIIVGGMGAIWPFVIASVAKIGQVWQSDSPEEDVARGASWWSEVNIKYGCEPETETPVFPDSQVIQTPERLFPKPEETTNGEEGIDDDDIDKPSFDPGLIPPWKRRNPDNL